MLNFFDALFKVWVGLLNLLAVAVLGAACPVYWIIYVLVYFVRNCWVVGVSAWKGKTFLS